MVVKKVTVHTDGKTMWVNSVDDQKCEVRICGLENLKHLRVAEAILHEDRTLKDITILR